MLHPAIICLLFWGSGFAGLVFEISWCRLLLRALGAGMNANSCVFAAFMAGSALGAIVAFRFPAALSKIGWLPAQSPAASSRDYFKAYGRLELMAGLSGFLICLLLNSRANEALAGFLAPFSDSVCLCNVLRFLICFVILLLPCSSMGAGFAALLRVFESEKKTFNYFPVLYGCNTLGAAAGSLLAAFFMLPFLGIAASAFAACAIDFLIFLSVELLSGANLLNYQPQASDNPSGNPSGLIAPPPSDPETAGSFQVWLSCVFLSGFLALMLEISWARIFSLVLGSSVYSVAAVLLMVLCGSGLASICIQIWRPGLHSAGRLVFAGFFLAGLATMSSCYLSKSMNWIFVEFSTYISPFLSGDPFNCAVISRLFLAFVYVFFASLFLGSVLPLAAVAAPSSRKGSQSILYAVNCLGALAACLLYSFALFPALQQITRSALLLSLLLVAGLSCFAAFLLKLREAFAGRGKQRLLPLALSLASAAIPASCLLIKPPQWDAGLMSSGFLLYRNDEAAAEAPASRKESLLKYDEGINSTVSASLYPESNSVSIRSDGKVEATLPVDPAIISPGSDLSTHVLLAALPLLFHDGDAESALLIGLGSGVTASTLLTFPELKHLSVAELEPAVAEICASLDKYNGAPLNPENRKSGRLNLRFDDARFALSASKQNYDLIVSQPADPWVSGSADLYTLEFWQLASSRLNRKGVFCQWVQLYAIPQQNLLSLIQTFRAVFKSVYICQAPGAGELLLLGYKDGDDTYLAQARKTSTLIDRRIKQSLQNSIFLAEAGVANAYDALGLILSGAKETGEICRAAPCPELNTDDKPYVEYATSRSILTSNSELKANFSFLSRLLSQSDKTYIPDLGNAEKLSWMGRALARLALQDATEFRAIRQNRAMIALDRAIAIKTTAFTCWSKAVVLSAFGKSEKTDIDRTLACSSGDDTDKLALFDLEFERNNLEKASELLQACQPETQASSSWGLRQAYLNLKKGKSSASLDIFCRLEMNEPCLLAALLGGSYAAQSQKDILTARTQTHRYLSINPWDFQTQLNYTLLLCRLNSLSDAYAHARCAAQLRPNDASALILLLKYQLMSKDWDGAKKIIGLIKKSGRDPDAGKILKLLDSRNEPKRLLDNPAFDQLVKEKVLSAEDPKNGYKILGEP